MSTLLHAHVPAVTVLARFLARFREPRTPALLGISARGPRAGSAAMAEAGISRGGSSADAKAGAGACVDDGFTWPAAARGLEQLGPQARIAGLS